MTTPLPAPPSRPADLHDDFVDGPDPDLWVSAYLPHWTTPERAAARCSTTPEGLELRIDDDQLDWRPEDAPLRVSNLQTGSFSGPMGSTRGTHRHRPDGLTVRTETPARLLWAPSRGRVDVRASASRSGGCMLAAWLVGTEHRSAEESGEVCLFEIDAQPSSTGWSARTGVKAHSDPHLQTDMSSTPLGFDASRPHTWTAIWGSGETVIGVDGRVIRRVPQTPEYPLFLMIDLFEVAPPAGGYPKTATIHSVRGWSD